MKAKTRKARGDSKLDSLPLDKRKELIDGLLCGWTYVQAADWLQVECGESVSSSAWTPFYQRHVEPLRLEIRKFALMSATSLAEMAEAEDVFTKATIAEFKENAYQLMRTPGADPEEKRKWMETLIKEAAGKRDDRKLRLLEENARTAKAQIEAATAKAKSLGGISEETLKELEEAAKLL